MISFKQWVAERGHKFGENGKRTALSGNHPPLYHPILGMPRQTWAPIIATSLNADKNIPKTKIKNGGPNVTDKKDNPFKGFYQTESAEEQDWERHRTDELPRHLVKSTRGGLEGNAFERLHRGFPQTHRQPYPPSPPSLEDPQTLWDMFVKSPVGQKYEGLSFEDVARAYADTSNWKLIAHLNSDIHDGLGEHGPTLISSLNQSKTHEPAEQPLASKQYIGQTTGGNVEDDPMVRGTVRPKGDEFKQTAKTGAMMNRPHWKRDAL